MTHFVCLAIVPKEVVDKKQVDSFIAELMEPYSEELRVPPYVDKPAKEVKAEFDKIMKEAKKLTEEKMKDKEYMRKYKTNPKMTLAEWAEDWYGKKLDEEGNLLTQYNPEAFFDWYRIGGRWDGCITGNVQKSENGFNFADKHETVENNCIPAKVLLDKYREEIKDRAVLRKATQEIYDDLMSEFPFGKQIGFADLFREFNKNEKIFEDNPNWNKFYDDLKKRIAEQIKNYQFQTGSEYHKVIDQFGVVHSAKDYGWFGMSKDTQKDDKWEKEYIDVLEKAKDGYVVNLDCHI